MLAALATLAVYAGTAAVALSLAHRWIFPVPLRAALVLSAAPLLFTGRAIVTNGILAPLDVAYQGEPLHAIAAAHGADRATNPLLVDVVSQMLPWRKAVRASVAEGRFPLWNRYVLAGEPLLGVAQPAVFHPGTWIGLALPLTQAWNFDVSLRLLTALVCAFLFFRGIGAAEVSALLGAFAWGFSDFLLFFAGYPVTPSVAPFPLLLLGLLRLVEGGGRRAVGLTTAALVLTAVAGHPETLLFSVTGAGVFFVAELFRAKPGKRLRPVLLSLVAGALALGLSAVVLLPFLEILPQTWQHALRGIPGMWGSRSAPMDEVLRRLVPSLVPYAYGVPGRSRVVERLILPAGYAGTLLLPFAAAGLAGRAPRRWLFLGLALLGLALNVRLAPVAVPLSKLPLFDIAVNDYFIFLTSFGLAGLGVLGAERLLRGEGAAPFVAGAAAAALAVSAVAAARAEGLSLLGMDGGYLGLHLVLQVAVPVGAALLVRASARRGRRLGLRTVVLLTAAFVAQRRIEEGGVYPTYPQSAFYPPLEVLGPVPRGAPVRMAALHYAFAPNIAAMYGLEDVRGYEAMTLRSYAETYGWWCTQLPASYNRVDDATSPWLALLGARYVLVPRGASAPEGWRELANANGSRLVENPGALPRAFAPEHVAWIGDRDRAFAIAATIRDFARDGVVGAPRPGPLGWLPNGPAGVSVTSYEEDRLTFSIESASRVFVGTSIPAWKGWRLTLDGRAAPLLPFNHAFLGFEAPAGRHIAVLRYLPAGFVAGAAISATAFALTLFLLARGPRRAPARAAPGLA